MNRFWLKIAVLVSAIVIIIAGVYVLWPKTPDSRQISKQKTTVSASQPKRQLKIEDFQSSAGSKSVGQNPREQQLRQKAALLSTLCLAEHKSLSERLT